MNGVLVVVVAMLLLVVLLYGACLSYFLTRGVYASLLKGVVMELQAPWFPFSVYRLGMQI